MGWQAEVAACLKRREALDCMYEYDKGIRSEGTYCTGTGTFALSLQDDDLRRNILRSNTVRASEGIENHTRIFRPLST